MSSHSYFEELLARRRELPLHDEGILRRHLESCDECRNDAPAYARQDALLRVLPIPIPTTALDAVETRVLDTIAQRPESQTETNWWSVFRLASVAAVLVLLTTVAVYHQWPRTQRPAVSAPRVTPRSTHTARNSATPRPSRTVDRTKRRSGPPPAATVDANPPALAFGRNGSGQQPQPGATEGLPQAVARPTATNSVPHPGAGPTPAKQQPGSTPVTASTTVSPTPTPRVVVATPPPTDVPATSTLPIAGPPPTTSPPPTSTAPADPIPPAIGTVPATPTAEVGSPIPTPLPLPTSAP